MGRAPVNLLTQAVRGTHDGHGRLSVAVATDGERQPLKEWGVGRG